MTLEDALPAAADELHRRFGVQTLWLFGSGASGSMDPESDVDLAGLFSRRPTPDELSGCALELAARFGRPVDLIDLRASGPVLARQVLASGRILMETQRAARQQLEMMLPAALEDLRITRAPIDTALVHRVLHERL